MSFNSDPLILNKKAGKTCILGNPLQETCTLLPGVKEALTEIVLSHSHRETGIDLKKRSFKELFFPTSSSPSHYDIKATLSTIKLSFLHQLALRIYVLFLVCKYHFSCCSNPKLEQYLLIKRQEIALGASLVCDIQIIRQFGIYDREETRERDWVLSTPLRTQQSDSFEESEEENNAFNDVIEKIRLQDPYEGNDAAWISSLIGIFNEIEKSTWEELEPFTNELYEAMESRYPAIKDLLSKSYCDLVEKGKGFYVLIWLYREQKKLSEFSLKPDAIESLVQTLLPQEERPYTLTFPATPHPAAGVGDIARGAAAHPASAVDTGALLDTFWDSLKEKATANEMALHVKDLERDAPHVYYRLNEEAAQCLPLLPSIAWNNAIEKDLDTIARENKPIGSLLTLILFVKNKTEEGVKHFDRAFFSEKKFIRMAKELTQKYQDENLIGSIRGFLNIEPEVDVFVARLLRAIKGLYYIPRFVGGGITLQQHNAIVAVEESKTDRELTAQAEVAILRKAIKELPPFTMAAPLDACLGVLRVPSMSSYIDNENERKNFYQKVLKGILFVPFEKRSVLGTCEEMFDENVLTKWLIHYATRVPFTHAIDLKPFCQLLQVPLILTRLRALYQIFPDEEMEITEDTTPKLYQFCQNNALIGALILLGIPHKRVFIEETLLSLPSLELLKAIQEAALIGTEKGRQLSLNPTVIKNIQAIASHERWLFFLQKDRYLAKELEAFKKALQKRDFSLSDKTDPFVQILDPTSSYHTPSKKNPLHRYPRTVHT